MTTDRRDARIILGWAYDQASHQQVERGLNQITQTVSAETKEIQNFGGALGDLNPVTQFAVNNLMRRFDMLGRNIEDDRRIVQALYGDFASLDERSIEPDIKLEQLRQDTRFVEGLRAELLALDGLTVEPEIRVQQTGGGRSRRNSGGLETADRFGMVASQILGGVGAGELGGIANLVGDIAGGVTSLGALGVATAAIAPVIGLATSAIQKNEERERQRAQVIESAAQIIYDATTKEIDARIRGYQSEIEQSQLAIAIIEEETGRNADYLAKLNDLSLANASAAASIPQVIDLIGGLGAQAAKIDENNQAIENANYAIELLTRYRESESVATNDSADAANKAAEAEQRLADERRNTFVDEAKRAGQELANQANKRLEIDRMTAEERRTRALEVQRNIELLSGDRQAYLAQQTTAGGQAAYLLGQQIADLQDELIKLIDTTVTSADVLAEAAARTEALAGQTDAHFDALTREVEAREAVTKATNEYNESVAEAQAKRQELEDKTEDRRTEIVDAAAEKRTDIEERGEQDRAKLLRDFTRTYTNAVGERDALAARRAQESAADRLQDQRESEDEALRSSAEARDKQIRSLDKSYAEQQSKLEQSLQREAGTRVAAINRAQVDAVNAANAQASIATYGANGLRTIQNNYWRDVNSIAVQWANNTVNSLRGIMGSIAAQQANQGIVAGSPAAYDFYGMGSFSSPTPLPAPITGYGTQGSGGVVYSPTINANGLNAAQAEAVAYRAFSSALHDAGYGLGGR